MNSIISHHPSPGNLRSGQPPPAPPPESDRLEIGPLVEGVRRRFGLFCLVFAAVLAVAVVLTLRQSPTYTASSAVMMDPRQLQLFQRTASPNVSGDLSLSTEAVGTQVEILRSRQMAERVVNELQLDRDASFQASKPGLRGRLMSGLGGLFGGRRQAAVPLTQDQRRQAVIDYVMAHLNADRLGLTYVIQISVVDRLPGRAAAIANAYAKAYVDQSLEGKTDATRQAGGYLNSRLRELSDQAARDAAAVQQYKVAHNLLGETGATLTEQEISSLNTQIATARAEAAADQARLDTARAQLKAGSSGEDVGAALESPVIQSLRSQRATVSGSLAELTGRYGPRHPDVIKAKRQLDDIDGQIRAEIGRVISNLQARAKVSVGRLVSLEQTLGRSRSSLAVNTQAQAGIIELQGKSAASQTLYDNYLGRFKEVMASAGTEQSDARLVSLARIPQVPTSPRVPLDIALGVILAAIAGTLAGLGMELADRSFSSGPDIERRLRVPYLASIPLLASVAKGSREVPTDYVVTNPFSVFAEAFRNLRISVLQAGPSSGATVLTVTSPLTAEGKTTTAVCLAETASMQGVRTIILDCDLRRRTLQQFMDESPKAGLVEVVLGQVRLDDAIVTDPRTGLDYLPLSRSKLTTGDILGSQGMDDLLEQLRRTYEFIILDTAPILAVADARVLACKSDAVIVLCRWRETAEDAVKSALRLILGAGAPLAGVVLTRVDVRRQAARGYGDSTYYFRQTQQYYVS